jgi:hypothetical protein
MCLWQNHIFKVDVSDKWIIIVDYFKHVSSSLTYFQIQYKIITCIHNIFLFYVTACLLVDHVCDVTAIWDKWTGKSDKLHVGSECQMSFFFSRTIYIRWNDNDVHFVLDQNTQSDSYSASWQKQQFSASWQKQQFSSCFGLVQSGQQTVVSVS